MSDVVVISGAGPYADPWHPFADTSARLAAIVDSAGYAVHVREDVEPALADPGPCRLVVINIGNPSDPRPAEPIAAARAGLEGHLAAGGAVLGVHSSATSLTTMARWPAILGGRWVRGHSMHPAQSEASIRISAVDHPITHGLGDFRIFDERYSYLETKPDITVLGEHSHDGLRHPLIWCRQTDRSRIVYDGLGHDTRSYDCPAHVDLLRRAARWLLGDL
jgi:uncharacterized protein